MGAVNEVVPHADLRTSSRSSGRREINGKSPTAIRMLKYGLQLIDDGLVGQQLFAGEPPASPTGRPRRRRGATPSWRAAGRTGRPTLYY